MTVLACASIAVGCGGSKAVKTVTETTATTVTFEAEPAAQPGATTTTDSSGATPDGETKPTSASIVPFIGIGAVKLGMKRPAVETAIGVPTSEKSEVTELGSYVNLTYDGLVVHLRGETNTVVQIDTTRPSDTTKEGVGVGSTEAQVTAAFPKASCDTGPYPHICRLDDGNGSLTDFRVAAGAKVAMVTVGYLVD